MKINDFVGTFSNIVEVSPLSSTEWELKTKACFANGEYIKIILQKEGNGWFYTDKKETLKYMNELYDLKSVDVKHCISAVIKIYGFSIVAGALKTEIVDEATIATKFFDFVMCIAQLSNMYAFFDKPE